MTRRTRRMVAVGLSFAHRHSLPSVLRAAGIDREKLADFLSDSRFREALRRCGWPITTAADGSFVVAEHRASPEARRFAEEIRNMATEGVGRS